MDVFILVSFYIVVKYLYGYLTTIESKKTSFIKTIFDKFVDMYMLVSKSGLGPVCHVIPSDALSGKLLLVRIIEHNKIDAYFRLG